MVIGLVEQLASIGILRILSCWKVPKLCVPPLLDIVELVTSCLGILASLVSVLLGLDQLGLHVIKS